MRIIKTNVPDIIGTSIDQQKVALADEIIMEFFHYYHLNEKKR